jgi:hypothetical protein
MDSQSPVPKKESQSPELSAPMRLMISELHLETCTKVDDLIASHYGRLNSGEDFTNIVLHTPEEGIMGALYMLDVI